MHCGFDHLSQKLHQTSIRTIFHIYTFEELVVSEYKSSLSLTEASVGHLNSSTPRELKVPETGHLKKLLARDELQHMPCSLEPATLT